jgi:hypothetical protein
MWRNEVGSYHGLVLGVTHDSPGSIKQNYTIFPSVFSILRKDLIKKVSHMLDQK